MKVSKINNNVKKLLLEPKFLELVYDASSEVSNANSEMAMYTKKLLTKYTLGDISDAKYILLHLDENLGYISDEEVEELRNRIKSYLKTLK